MNQPSDNYYINRALDGSVGDFEHLVTRYEDRLYRFLLARTGQVADAEDVLQETFVAAYTYLYSFKSKYSFSTWLYTIALRKLGKTRVANARAGTLTADPQPESNTSLLADTPPDTPFAALEPSDRLELWLLIKRCLGTRQFDLIWLYYVESLSVQELSTAMKRSASWVKINLHRARQKLSREPDLRDMFQSVSHRKKPGMTQDPQDDDVMTAPSHDTTIEESS